MKKSEKRGERTLIAEVTNVSGHGFWLMLGTEEKFVSFESFPWFRDASIRQITNVERQSDQHLYWPTLDIDIWVESLDHPERFPLVSRVANYPDSAIPPRIELDRLVKV